MLFLWPRSTYRIAAIGPFLFACCLTHLIPGSIFIIITTNTTYIHTIVHPELVLEFNKSLLL